MSNYLFATPSFLSGAARTLDLWGTFDGYNESLDPCCCYLEEPEGRPDTISGPATSARGTS